MKILQIVEESPSLDFSLPIFEFLNDSDEIIVFSTFSITFAQLSKPNPKTAELAKAQGEIIKEIKKEARNFFIYKIFLIYLFLFKLISTLLFKIVLEATQQY